RPQTAAERLEGFVMTTSQEKRTEGQRCEETRSQSISRAPRCEALLSATRALARQRKGWTDRACGVLDSGGGQYIVDDEHGEPVWKGSAHCPSCARVEAITKMIEAGFVLSVDGVDTQSSFPGPEAAMRPAIRAHCGGGRVIRLRSP